jgi:hypothetical protein
VWKRHVFMMLVDCFNANLDLYDRLCGAASVGDVPSVLR